MDTQTLEYVLWKLRGYKNATATAMDEFPKDEAYYRARYQVYAELLSEFEQVVLAERAA